jgi:hypothetical protein
MTDFTSFRAPVPTRSARPFRILLGAFACLLASFGVWVTAAEWLRADGQMSAWLAEGRRDDVDKARLAATIGLVRGELWTEYAAMSLRSPRPGPEDAALRDEARRAGEAAAGLAPLDSEAWLVLSELSLDHGASNALLAGLLNMSFLTGPNARGLMARRLALVARSPVRTDQDIRAFALRDVRILAQQAGGGGGQLAALWRGKPPEERDFLAGLLQNVDGKLLESILNTR